MTPFVNILAGLWPSCALLGPALLQVLCIISLPYMSSWLITQTTLYSTNNIKDPVYVPNAVLGTVVPWWDESERPRGCFLVSKPSALLIISSSGLGVRVTVFIYSQMVEL